MIIYGSRSTHLESVEAKNIPCEYCNETRTFQLSIFGKYAHVFWLPIFFLGKPAVAECTHCKRTISKKEFNHKLMMKYEEVKSSAKRPFWQYILPALFLLWIISAVIGIIMSSAS